jgi:hypothetical protein
MTVFYMRFPGQFSQIGFSCYLLWKYSKNTHGTHFWGCWAFFSENQPNVMNFEFFFPFWQNMLLVWLTNNNKFSGALRKRCLKVKKLKDLKFLNFRPVFWPVLTVFLLFQKNLGGTVRKKKFMPKSNFSHAKVDMKAKKYTHFV